MLIKHIIRYDVGEQVGRNKQAVRTFFQIDKRRNLKSTVGGIAVRHVKFVEQAVSVGLTNLAYIVASGYNTAVGIDSTPVEFKLLFEIVFIAVVHICQVAVCFLHTCCTVHYFVNGVHSAVGQVIGGRRMALPRVADVQLGGVDTKLARFAYAIYVVECGVVRAVEIIKTLVDTRSRRHGDSRDIACARIIVVE